MRRALALQADGGPNRLGEPGGAALRLAPSAATSTLRRARAASEAPAPRGAVGSTAPIDSAEERSAREPEDPDGGTCAWVMVEVRTRTQDGVAVPGVALEAKVRAACGPPRKAESDSAGLASLELAVGPVPPRGASPLSETLLLPRAVGSV